MKQRVITGALVALILIAVLVQGRFWLDIALGFIAVLAAYELCRAVELTRRLLLFAAVVAAVVVLRALSMHSSMYSLFLFGYMTVLFLFCMTGLAAFSDVTAALFITVYVGFFEFISHIRGMQDGYLLVWLVFLCAFATDTFAMLGGKFLGRHKLCPKLSPKKTVEGSVCGFVGSVLGCVLFGWVAAAVFGKAPSYTALAVLGGVASVFSQLGDLAASGIKRQFGMKDFGTIMPGHGGIMDRFDSVLFAGPTIYYFLQYVSIFK